jgi:glyoxylase-like metal-dependent hydrolase (beta-lactamase superfamily II)
MADRFEVLAVRYGSWESTKSHCFHRYGSYGEPDAAVAMDFFCWLIRDGSTTVLVDTGFNPATIGSRPGRRCLVPPVEAIAALGVDPASVRHLVLTHLHYDHTGNVAAFPNARLYVQRRELDFWTTGYGLRPPQAALTEPAELAHLRRAADRGAVEAVDGTTEVLPGIRLVRVGGHTPGQQIVIVGNERPVVLASDSVHYYEEVERDRPYELFSSLTEVYDGYALLRGLQRDSGALLVAGHDPLVMHRFPLVHNDFTVRIGAGEGQ